MEQNEYPLAQSPEQCVGFHVSPRGKCTATSSGSWMRGMLSESELDPGTAQEETASGDAGDGSEKEW